MNDINHRQVVENLATQLGCKSISQLSRKLQVSRQTIYRWRENGIPIERCVWIQKDHGIPAAKLRPDMF